MSKHLFPWDDDHLEQLTIQCLKEAQSDYTHFLGEGSPLVVSAQVFFQRIQQVVSELAKCAGAISPSLRALSGIVAVGANCYNFVRRPP